MSKMEEIAKKFGKKLEEKFLIDDGKDKFYCKFTEVGFYFYQENIEMWNNITSTLPQLLEGRMKIVEEK